MNLNHASAIKNKNNEKVHRKCNSVWNMKTNLGMANADGRASGVHSPNRLELNELCWSLFFPGVEKVWCRYEHWKADAVEKVRVCLEEDSVELFLRFADVVGNSTLRIGRGLEIQGSSEALVARNETRGLGVKLLKDLFFFMTCEIFTSWNLGGEGKWNRLSLQLGEEQVSS